MAKVPQTLDDLEHHRREQMGFLQRSAQGYDRGFVDEAKRLAVTIRVLLHDTNQSKSLLGQLGDKDRDFYDTAVAEEVGNTTSYGALVQMAFSPAGAMYIPYLDDPLPEGKPSLVPFAKWWARIIFRNSEGQPLSRKDLVLCVANQDGGAHVDPNLDEKYAKLRDESLGWVFSKDATHYKVRPAELAAVRQIAHEVLKTFDPSLEAHPSKPEGSLLMARSGFREATEEEIAEMERKGQIQRKPTP
jgi:hypothetical protein